MFIGLPISPMVAYTQSLPPASVIKQAQKKGSTVIPDDDKLQQYQQILELREKLWAQMKSHQPTTLGYAKRLTVNPLRWIEIRASQQLVVYDQEAQLSFRLLPSGSFDQLYHLGQKRMFSHPEEVHPLLPIMVKSLQQLEREVRYPVLRGIAKEAQAIWEANQHRAPLQGGPNPSESTLFLDGNRFPILIYPNQQWTLQDPSQDLSVTFNDQGKILLVHDGFLKKEAQEFPEIEPYLNRVWEMLWRYQNTPATTSETLPKQSYRPPSDDIDFNSQSW